MCCMGRGLKRLLLTRLAADPRGAPETMTKDTNRFAYSTPCVLTMRGLLLAPL